MRKIICPKCRSSEYVVCSDRISRLGSQLTGGYGATMATGATIGSIIPGIGTIAGGIVSAIGGYLVGEVIGRRVGHRIDQHLQVYRCCRCHLNIKIKR